VTPPLDVAALFQRLNNAGVDFVLIGGLAVNAHGVIRSTKDVDIVPAADPQNLARLAALLKDLDARQLGVGDDGFSENEMPLDPTRPEDLRQGGNFRLETTLGALDVMQWVAGIDDEHAFKTLAAEARIAQAFGTEIRVCSLRHLQTMKQAAGRPQDIQDLADLAAAHSDQ
jgi:predicted nucleotidyltransferase